MNSSDIIKSGSLILVDSGEYGDYLVLGFCRALKDFNPFVELEKYKEIHQDKSGRYNYDDVSFYQQLISSGLLEQLKFDRLFLGSFGDIKGVRFQKEK